MVGEQDELALLSPHPLPLKLLDEHCPGAAPLVQFDRVERVGSLLDKE